MFEEVKSSRLVLNAEGHYSDGVSGFQNQANRTVSY